jgi:chemotaxis protein CheD
MNQFIYPVAKNRRKATPVYGNAAVSGLIRLMESAGCKKENLESHILGGAIPEGKKKHDTGEKNIRVARELLDKKGIKVVSEDVGGLKGRKIAFDVKSGQVMVMKVHRIRSSDWRR